MRLEGDSVGTAHWSARAPLDRQSRTLGVRRALRLVSTAETFSSSVSI